MKIIKEKKIEDCLEGSNFKDFLLDSLIDKSFIDYLGRLGKMIFIEDIEKPFFKIIVRGKYTIKGSLGNKTIRILLPDIDNSIAIYELKEYINSYE